MSVLSYRVAYPIAKYLKADLYTTFIAPFYFYVIAANFGYVLVRSTTLDQTKKLLPHDQLLALETVVRASPVIVAMNLSLKHIVSKYPAVIMIGEDPISPQLWPLLQYLWATRGKKSDVRLHCYLVDVDSNFVKERRYFVFEAVIGVNDVAKKHVSLDFLTFITPALNHLQLIDVPRFSSSFYMSSNSIYLRDNRLKLPRLDIAKLREATKRVKEAMSELLTGEQL